MSTCMKLKVLEEHLQSLEGFKAPKVILEQYATPSHIAAVMVHTIQTKYDDIEGKFVADMGAGCGILSSAAALLGASTVIAFEIDDAAIEIFRANREELEIENIDLVQCDVLSGISSRFSAIFDTVLLNPPFGTKNNTGIDMKFLEQAIVVSNGTVYSLHKTSTRSHVTKKSRSWNVDGDVVAELKFDLPSTYRFHKRKSVDIEVDLWRFEINR